MSMCLKQGTVCESSASQLLRCGTSRSPEVVCQLCSQERPLERLRDLYCIVLCFMLIKYSGKASIFSVFDLKKHS